jgi:outer membrane protein TolC
VSASALRTASPKPLSASWSSTTLAQAARRVEAFQGQQVQVGLYPNPVIGYQAEEVGENGGAGQHGLFFRQEIVTSNKLGLNRAVAAHEVQQAEWDLRMQRQRILNDVRSRAYDVLAAQRTMEIADGLAEVFRKYDIAREQVEQYRRDILPYAKQALDLTRTGYEQGEFSYLELLTAQQTFSRTNLAYVSRLRELWLATVQIDGMLLSGGLEAPGR